MLAVGLVYAGFLVLFLGFIAVIKPLSFLKIKTRKQGGLVLASGFLLLVVGTALPAAETRVASPQTRLDEFVPVYQFHEVHSIRIEASTERVYRAIKEVTADEIALFRTLTWIRRLGRPRAESILNAPEKQPILDVATRTSFLLLADEPEREIVLGTLVVAPAGWRPKGQATPEDFKALHASGFALAAMNFRLEDTGPDACLLTTETRVYATDAGSRRKFARYWRIIYPGSALLRRMWLRAIRERSEG
jgi:hypothetical protein